MNTFFPGTRVLVFDWRLYKDDKKTPPDVTLKPATVTCWYGRRSRYHGWTYDNLIDVQFDHRDDLSKGHFTSSVSFV